MYHVVIKGTGSCVPNHIMKNEDLAAIVDTSDEWIRTRTGIESRHISIKENTSDLAYESAKRACDMAGVTTESVELIICATLTPDYFTPSTACVVQDLLGAKNAVAFDINAACSGFVYAITVAKQFIASGVYKNAVVIGSETLSKLLDWDDRTTCVLFGDGAGAVYLEQSQDELGVGTSILHADGSKRELLVSDAMPVRNECVSHAKAKTRINMIGGEVFKFAVKTIVTGIKEVLKSEDMSLSKIRWIIPHQANIRIIEAAAKLLGTSMDQFYVNLSKYGNTSSASIAIALDELARNNMLDDGDDIILVGFGGGMTSGAMLVHWNRANEYLKL